MSKQTIGSYNFEDMWRDEDKWEREELFDTHEEHIEFFRGVPHREESIMIIESLEDYEKMMKWD